LFFFIEASTVVYFLVLYVHASLHNFRIRPVDDRLETGANYVPALLYLAEW
jgi:hypothetical protein